MEQIHHSSQLKTFRLRFSGVTVRPAILPDSSGKKFNNLGTHMVHSQKESDCDSLRCWNAGDHGITADGNGHPMVGSCGPPDKSRLARAPIPQFVPYDVLIVVISVDNYMMITTATAAEQIHLSSQLETSI